MIHSMIEINPLNGRALSFLLVLFLHQKYESPDWYFTDHSSIFAITTSLSNRFENLISNKLLQKEIFFKSVLFGLLLILFIRSSQVLFQYS